MALTEQQLLQQGKQIAKNCPGLSGEKAGKLIAGVIEQYRFAKRLCEQMGANSTDKDIREALAQMQAVDKMYQEHLGI